MYRGVRWAAMAEQQGRATAAVAWRYLPGPSTPAGDASAREELLTEALAAEPLEPPAAGPVRLAHAVNGAPLLVGDSRTVTASHSRGDRGDWLAVGVAEGRVGVDLERVRVMPSAAALARRWFPTMEQQLLQGASESFRQPRPSGDDWEAAELFWQLWTRKEALAKALRLPLPDALGIPVPQGARPAGLRLRTWQMADHSSDERATLSAAADVQPLLVPSQPTITTARMRLRPLRIGDATFIDDLDAEPRVRRYTDQPPPIPGHGERTVRRWLAEAGQRPGVGFWLAVDAAAGTPIGWFHLRCPRPTEPALAGDLSLGYRLLPEVWGRGLATEGARALIRHGLVHLRAPRVTATALADNHASVAVMTRAGMRSVHNWEYHARDGSAKAAVLFAARRAGSVPGQSGVADR